MTRASRAGTTRSSCTCDGFFAFEMERRGAEMNPLQALVIIRSVTREMAIVETTTSATLERASRGGKPLLSFGRRGESDPGENCFYWRFSTAALEEMLLYAGFSRVECRYVECRKPFRLPPRGLRVTAAIAYP